MRKILIVLLVLISTRTLISCCKETLFKFRWSKATLTNINVPSDTLSVLVGDSSKAENFGFQLRFDLERVAHHFIQDFGLNSSYALKCDRDYQNMDSVQSIEVRTRSDFDATHSAGSIITEYLVARPGTIRGVSVPMNTYKPVSENLSYINMDLIPTSSLLDFRFTGVTPFPGQHTFILIVSFKSGRTLSDSTSIKFY